MSQDHLDGELVRSLYVEIADEMTALRQRRHPRREPLLSRGEEEQLMLSLMQTVVDRHVESLLSRGQELPSACYGERLVEMIDQTMFRIRDVDFDGCDEPSAAPAVRQPVGDLEVARR